ncbi:hypothetical protein AMR42_03070 [Limnothrix sp. PR1529]|uniref:hypothetical protein n=1 Tax=Limnothrix sp. PR1529 TaxID=1704291 RepID=UPI00081E1ABE|nr:hypothetical protein [Limnothrix sp. PR1529]OCQ96755.1 hypothetical protein BCR12_08325 [Limnothrix sp. P13C2]PIB15106.1 hypothetical protein AMR42_03070 [Limnothrix sp. PR1529]
MVHPTSSRLPDLTVESPTFIQENFLYIGYVAWQGYLKHGRGIVACVAKEAVTTRLGWIENVTARSVQYIPFDLAALYLDLCLVPVSSIDRLLNTIKTYAPDREILILVKHGQEVEIDWLQNLAIAPSECYHQVCDRWSEFNLAS